MRSIPRAPARALTAVAVALLTAAFTLLGFAGAGVASAHATLIGTDPADGTVLTESPQRVAATFNEPMQSTFAAMTVVGPDGNLWSDDEAQVDGAVVSVSVRPLGPAGDYTVNYRATSADGHVVSGSWSFELSVAGTGTPGPSATTTTPAGDDNAMPVWPFVLLAALIVAGGALWAVRRQR